MSSSVTADDVRVMATKLGVEVDSNELKYYHTLLEGANETFQRILALPDYYPEVDTERFPRKNIHFPTPEENQLGVAWTHTFSIGGADKNPSGLLAGKTLCVKDNICVAGVPQVMGTDMVQPWVPQTDATLVTRILEAGGELVGTTTCENMSYAPASNTSAAGTVHNPYGNGYSAGGSSSGVSALVGSPANLVDMGVGVDQGGSNRIPSAMCGSVGMKPTFGIIPYTGVVSSEAALDCCGPTTKSVMDAAILLEVVAGRDDLDDRSHGAQKHGEIKYSSDLKSWYDGSVKAHGDKVLTGMRVAVLKEGMEAPSMRAEMKAKVHENVLKLRDLGAEVKEVSMPLHSIGPDVWIGIRRLGGSLALTGKASGRRGYQLDRWLENICPLTQEKWEKAPHGVKSTLINGTYALDKYPGLYAKCMNVGMRMTREYEKILSEYDVIVIPTIPSTAPHLVARDSNPLVKSQAEKGISLNTGNFNLTGNPAISVPIGFLPDLSGNDPNLKLPCAMQIIGPLYGDEKIFRVGHAFEKAFNWREG